MSVSLIAAACSEDAVDAAQQHEDEQEENQQDSHDPDFGEHVRHVFFPAEVRQKGRQEMREMGVG